MSRGLPIVINSVQFHAPLHEALDDAGMVLENSQVHSTPTLAVLEADVTALSWESLIDSHALHSMCHYLTACVKRSIMS